MHGSSRRGRPGPAAGHAKAHGRGAPPRPGPSQPAPDPSLLRSLLEPVVHAMNMDLEGIRVTSAGRRRVLRVIVDADGGVSLDDIALASRELSSRLDRAAEMGDEPYTLEVSSPGVDRPLTLPRHWRRNVGRLVVTSEPGGPDGERIEGRITSTSESGVVLERDGVPREYRYADLGPGRVQVEFGHLDDETGEEDIGGH
ncbi:MAG TPA: ribosome maturation factor RimP [Streptosporangiaceae bacterium]|nr:ribosome maturation factor RimP [Streptosporangiaceae bacterium]